MTGTPLTTKTFAGFLPVVGLSLLLGWRMVALNVVFLLIVALTLGYYKRKLGCITGDMLGAMTESTEALLFLTLSMRGLS